MTEEDLTAVLIKQERSLKCVETGGDIMEKITIELCEVKIITPAHAKGDNGKEICRMYSCHMYSYNMSL